MRITRLSPVSGEINTREIDVTVEQLDAWLEGALIQDAMPHLSADDREFILTGMTPEDWEEVFGDDAYGDEEPVSTEPECVACGLPLDIEHDRFCDADCEEIARIQREVQA